MSSYPEDDEWTCPEDALDEESFHDLHQRTGPEDLLEIARLAVRGAGVGGDHHKQYYLVQIARKLGVDFWDEEDEGIAP